VVKGVISAEIAQIPNMDTKGHLAEKGEVEEEVVVIGHHSEAEADLVEDTIEGTDISSPLFKKGYYWHFLRFQDNPT